MRIHTECLICKSQKIKQLSDYYESKGLVKCEKCGFVYMEKIPTIEDLNSHYEDIFLIHQNSICPL